VFIGGFLEIIMYLIPTDGWDGFGVLVIWLIKKQILLRREHEKVVRLTKELEGRYIGKRGGWWGNNGLSET